MFYYLKGELVLKQENFAVLDIGGVGYKIYTSQTSMDLVSPGSDVTFYTYVYVREDILDIYGFTTNDELAMFNHLLSVSGVGPKAALAILSVVLTKAAGVGAKVAQRVILELKSKLKNTDIVPEDVIGGGVDISAGDNAQEAVSALTVLGYSQAEAKKAVAKVDASLSTEEIIKQALIKLM